MRKCLKLLVFLLMMNLNLFALDIIPYVYIAGGFSSCPDHNYFSKAASCFVKPGLTSQMADQAKRLKLTEKLKQKYGQEPQYVFSCYSDFNPLEKKQLFFRFGKDSDLAQSNSGVFVAKRKSKHYERIVYKNFQQVNFEQNQTNIYFLTPLLKYLKKDFQKIEDQGKKIDLYVFGHSYGGFAGLHIAHQLQEHVKALATIDPISPLRCLAREMVFSPIDTLTKQHKGCQVAPNDPFSKRAIRELIDHFDVTENSWWQNSFQSAFPLLRSAAILPIVATEHGHRFTRFPHNREFIKAEFKKSDGDEHSQLSRLNLFWNFLFNDFVEQY